MFSLNKLNEFGVDLFWEECSYAFLSSSVMVPEVVVCFLGLMCQLICLPTWRSSFCNVPAIR